MARKTGCIGNFFLKFVLFFWLGVLNSRVFYVPKHCFCICHNLCPEPLITFFSAIPCSQYDLAQNSPSSTMEGRREQSGRTGLQLPLGTRSQLLFKRDGCTHFGVFFTSFQACTVYQKQRRRENQSTLLSFIIYNLRKTPQKQVDLRFA